MRIRIIKPEKCETCTQRTCSLNDVVTKSDFMNLKSEQYTCPVKILAYGPSEDQLAAGYIDSPQRDDGCFLCGLCVVHCSQNNLIIEDYECDARDAFCMLKDNGEVQAQGPSNVVAMSYLNILFAFGANTNLIRTMSFDGAVLDNNNEACLVEVDIGNDSLECCRRLLADIVLNNHKRERKVSKGLMVLNDFPKEGSRDVIPLIRKIKQFTTTKDIDIYITTFSLLKHFVFSMNRESISFDELLFNASIMSIDEYKRMLISNKTIDANDVGSLFQSGEGEVEFTDVYDSEDADEITVQETDELNHQLSLLSIQE